MLLVKYQCSINDGLWVIIMCQLGSSAVTNVLLYCVMLIRGETVHVGGQGVHENSPLFSLYFAVKLKILWNSIEMYYSVICYTGEKENNKVNRKY